MNKKLLIQKLLEAKKAIPILFFPMAAKMEYSLMDILHDSHLQAMTMKRIIEEWEVGALISMMDLSIEAEAFGAHIRFHSRDVPDVVAPIVHTQEDVMALPIPTIGRGRTRIVIEGIAQTIEMLPNQMLFAGVIGPFSLATRLMGMMDTLMNCYDEPEMLHLLLSKIQTFIIEYILALKKAGACGVFMAEPAAGLLSPQLCDEFSSNYVKEIKKRVSDTSFIFAYHNCGNILPLLSSIKQVEADIYHVGDAVDVEEVLKIIPKHHIIMGNISPSKHFFKGSEESVYEATMALLKQCQKYPNFILSSGCDIPLSTPQENIRAFFDAMHDFKSFIDNQK
ncbi:MAG: uroporphyrinogen decarboxylase family protein [Bacilli bacterium]|nr:uroporphyrinogen decarboxylase family protein [Bacilli bacterium]